MKYLNFLMIVLIGLGIASCEEKAIEVLREKYKAYNEQAEHVSVAGEPVTKKVRFLELEAEVLPEWAALKQIALIRHGEPDLNKLGRFNYEEAKQYIKNYDSVGILVPDEPFFVLEEEEKPLIFMSNLERARSTAHYLFGTEREITESAEFREFERSLGDRRLKMDLPLRYWTITARIEWLLGINEEGIESFEEARDRARAGAIKLAAHTERHDKVVLVAHGFLNRYIKKYLKDLGWEVVRDGGSDYLAATILAKIEKEEGSIAKMD